MKRTYILGFNENEKQQCAGLQKKRPVLHYTILFSVYNFNSNNFTCMYLDWWLFNIKIFPKSIE